MEKPNISLVIGAVIKSKIEELKLEETLTHESLGRCSARDLFDDVYRAAMNSNNPESFLKSVRYWSKCGTEESEGGKKLIVEFYK